MRIAVLCGGPSGEHEVSVNSGWQVLQHLDPAHSAIPVLIEKTGDWRIGAESKPASWPQKELLSAVFAAAPPRAPLAAAQALQRLQVECVFVIVHGPGGEDGRLQGFLEIAGLSYTGTGVLGSALAMDKIRSKAIYRQAGIPTPDSLELEINRPHPSAEQVIERLGLPVVVKAPSQGSSVGMAIVRSAEELAAAITRLMPLENRLLLEAFVSGRELTCGVIGPLPATASAAAKPAYALPPTEIRPKLADYFDYRAKYEPGGSEEITPAPVEAGINAEIQRLALAAHAALGLGGMSRTDLILGPEGLQVLETNTLPGLTATSLLPQQAAAAGLDFTALLEEILARPVA